MNASSKDEVNILLQQIKDTNDDGIEDWLKYYKQPYVLSSLNQFISNIDHEIWRKSGGNTNNAEAAHSMVNREGKQLKLLSAILRGKRYDERCYKTIEIHNKAGVSYTHTDKSEIKRTCGSITRKGFRNQKNKESVIDLTNDELSNKSSSKRKLSPSTNRKSSKKSRKEPSENDNEILELEIEERKMALRERAIKARTAEVEVRKLEVEVEALELANLQQKQKV
ncbi:unnamed protein product [Rhizophagus irregularis]|nr:unnamed protein product [Rhizophagus irregularis]